MKYRVDVDFPGGNACDISLGERDGLDTVSFASDPHGGPECLWFDFRLRRTRPQEPAPKMVRLVWENFGNVLGGSHPEQVRPVLRRDGGDWERLPAGTREELPDGRIHAAWVIEPPAEWAEAAFCYPYGPDDVDALVSETNGYWRCDTIGVSQGSRPLRRLSDDYGGPGRERPGVYLIARQHSGETPGSWVLDGLLRYLATLGAEAPLTWAVPLTNIDGVVQGDYGKDNFPYDLNRAWGGPPMRHEVLVYQRDLQRWKSRCQPVLAVDLHAPAACEMDGIYTYLPATEGSGEPHLAALRWATCFSESLGPELASSSFSRMITYRSRWETPTFTAHCLAQGPPPALTFEIPYAMVRQTLLTRERYRDAGRRMGEAIVKGIRTL